MAGLDVSQERCLLDAEALPAAPESWSVAQPTENRVNTPVPV